MPVVRQPNLSDTTPFSVRDIESQAQSLLLRARAAAEHLLAEARKQADAMRLAAQEDGFVEGQRIGHEEGTTAGREAGHAAALAELQPRLAGTWAAVTAMLNELESHRVELETVAVNEVVDLAAAIARKVTRRQAAIDPGVLVDAVREALRFAVHAADVQVAVHPSQRAIIETELPSIRMEWPELRHVELVDDATLSPGGCRIATKHGRVDADVDGQLDRVINEMLNDDR